MKIIDFGRRAAEDGQRLIFPWNSQHLPCTALYLEKYVLFIIIIIIIIVIIIIIATIIIISTLCIYDHHSFPPKHNHAYEGMVQYVEGGKYKC